MCVDDKTCCPLYEDIQKGKIFAKCKKCPLYKRISRIILLSKVGLCAAIVAYIISTFIIY